MRNKILILLLAIVILGCNDQDKLTVYFSDSEARDWITGKFLDAFFLDDPYWDVTKVKIDNPSVFIKELEIIKEKLKHSEYDNTPQYFIDQTPFKFAFLTKEDTIYLNHTLSTWYYKGRCGAIDSSQVIVNEFSKYNEWEGTR